ncbi:MAG: hypothetical protein ACXAEB_11610 [Candidatus Thorarchaeota archaeon]|jgi:hypothetical protein
MNKEETSIPMDEARIAVEGAVSRIALLHLSFSKMLADEFGAERAKDLIVKAILDYGERIAERVKDGRPDLPEFGVYEESGRNDEGRYFARGCTLAKVFNDYDALGLGCLYCYVDAARWMATDAEAKIIHLTCEACGDDVCTFDMVTTTKEEREAFSKRSRAWRKVDPLLHEYGK